jgi:hypothetical protein
LGNWAGRAIAAGRKTTVKTTVKTSVSLRIQARIAALVTAIGAVLMAVMIRYESEPGLLPLLLVAGGTTWFVLTRIRLRARR